ncbi:molecular chaperone IbpA [Litorimonas taeanensis]|uniref:Molecular chaperone IbpA n=1 Tax=Litorimonas taeanensis TaxID=568099 RepID=A0A420WFA3_9PROT|nr:Hsp20 family protein [Litorimonas taeanensis]RKQ69670.1 molecular chaperone IbpA [Litorimonas taeanensis]
MRTYDFSPLYRNFVGFDRMANLIDAASQASANTASYPPYNVARLDEDSYRIELAVAGFDTDSLEIQTHENVLTISGSNASDTANDEVEYLHRGIAERGFERRFQLADHVRVTGANLNNGLLVITLQREVPEALKPRTVAITNSDQKLITPKPSGKAKAA